MACTETVDGLCISQIFAQDLKRQVVICAAVKYEVTLHTTD